MHDMASNGYSKVQAMRSCSDKRTVIFTCELRRKTRCHAVADFFFCASAPSVEYLIPIIYLFSFHLFSAFLFFNSLFRSFPPLFLLRGELESVGCDSAISGPSEALPSSSLRFQKLFEKGGELRVANGATLP